MTHTEILNALSEAMILSNFTQDSQKAYSHSIKKFFEYTQLETETDLTPQVIRNYILYLSQTRRLSWSTIKINCSAIRYLCLQVIYRPDIAVSIPKRKTPKKLPSILSKNEVLRVINAGKNLKHRTMLATVYGTGVRVSELLNLQVSDIKSNEGAVLVRQGEGQKDRMTVLPNTLLKQLRAYWKVYRPTTYLFPNPRDPSRQMNRTSLHKIFHDAKKNAGVEGGRGIHTLRHCFATHSLDEGCDPFTIKWLLGHKSIYTTGIYLCLSTSRIKKIKSPLDVDAQ